MAGRPASGRPCRGRRPTLRPPSPPLEPLASRGHPLRRQREGRPAEPPSPPRDHAAGCGDGGLVGRLGEPLVTRLPQPEHVLDPVEDVLDDAAGGRLGGPCDQVVPADLRASLGDGPLDAGEGGVAGDPRPPPDADVAGIVPDASPPSRTRSGTWPRSRASAAPMRTERGTPVSAPAPPRARARSADTTDELLRGGAANSSVCLDRIRERGQGAARPPSGTTSPATGTSCRPGAGPQPCRRVVAVAGLVPGPVRPIRRAGGLPTSRAGWAEPAASRALRWHAATAARRTSASSRTHAGRACPSVWRAPSCRWACRNGCRPTTRGPSRPAATRTAGRSGRQATRRSWLAWASRPDYAGRGIPSRSGRAARPFLRTFGEKVLYAA